MAKTVDQFSTIEDFRKRYNELAVDVGDKTGLRTTSTGTIVDALNSLEDKSFYFQEFVYTATAAQTTFTGADSAGNHLKLRKDRLQVFKNGAHLIEGTNFNITGADTEGNYTNVVLTAGASAGDIIVVYAFTGSYLGTTSGTAGGGGHWTETAAKTIYNLNDEGIILNGNGTPDQTVQLESGYTIQLAGKTYVEDDMAFVANKSITISGSGRFVGNLNGNADTVTNGIYTSDTNTVTGTIIASNTVANTNLVNDSVTIGSTEVDLGATVTTFAGLSSVTSTNFVGNLTGDVTGTSSKVTVSDSTANTNFPVVFHDESDSLLDDTGALRYNPSTGTLLVPNLSVAGTTTTVDTVTMEASNAIIFEGATADAHETTLSIVDPTGDHTQYLINQGGYIPVLAAATTTAISSTPAELNVLDGVTAGTVSASLGVVVDSNKDIGSFRNITLTGELDAGSLDVSGDADIDGTLETDALTINGSALNYKAFGTSSIIDSIC